MAKRKQPDKFVAPDYAGLFEGFSSSLRNKGRVGLALGLFIGENAPLTKSILLKQINFGEFILYGLLVAYIEQRIKDNEVILNRSEPE